MDKFDKKTRSRIMAAIKSKNTSPELSVFKELKKRGIYFQRHYRAALGTPDIAVSSCKKAVFIDGDFWHGFRYPIWKKRLSSKFWRNKLERNRERDKLYHSKLCRQGWEVMRVWEHQVEKDFYNTITRITLFLSKDTKVSKWKTMKNNNTKIENMLKALSDEEVILINALSMRELKKRKIVRTRNIVGDIGEYRVIAHYNSTPNESKLQLAPEGTQNVDALSRKGERYSIKAITDPGKTTGVFYGLKTPQELKQGEQDSRLFEYAIIALLTEDYEIKEILELSWDKFLKHKRWHSTMRAWNLSLSKRIKEDCRCVYRLT